MHSTVDSIACLDSRASPIEEKNGDNVLRDTMLREATGDWEVGKRSCFQLRLANNEL